MDLLSQKPGSRRAEFVTTIHCFHVKFLEKNFSSERFDLGGGR